MAISYHHAAPTLNAAGISLDADFHTLRSSQVECLTELAKVQGYRAPRNANGSTARCFFQALQRAKTAGK